MTGWVVVARRIRVVDLEAEADGRPGGKDGNRLVIAIAAIRPVLHSLSFVSCLGFSSVVRFPVHRTPLGPPHSRP